MPRFRKVGPDKAVGVQGFDNYSWHTDPPARTSNGHRPVTVEFDLSVTEHAKTVVVWGLELDVPRCRMLIG
ncbi:MAG: hypothetical protein IPJ07_18010 [Acidobacteria bacterium]|nr:hypothetical protein [Acidobacteriota bacterium]